MGCLDRPYTKVLENGITHCDGWSNTDKETCIQVSQVTWPDNYIVNLFEFETIFKFEFIIKAFGNDI